MRFRYLRDPLFLACVGVYFVNRLILKAIWETGFVHEHLNDLICIPFWVPVMLWVERRLGLRRDDGPPEAVEIIIPLVVWSWVFEMVLPRTEFFGRYCVADHQDVLAYAAGAFGAAVFWRWWYGDGGSGERQALPLPDADSQRETAHVRDGEACGGGATGEAREAATHREARHAASYFPFLYR